MILFHTKLYLKKKLAIQRLLMKFLIKDKKILKKQKLRRHNSRLLLNKKTFKHTNIRRRKIIQNCVNCDKIK